MAVTLTRKERALLRQLTQEAWESELSGELEDLYETFCQWADKGMSAFDLTERIHQFHDGVSRERYKRYTTFTPDTAVAYAIARGVLGEESLDPPLLEKLLPQIDAFRDREDD